MQVNIVTLVIVAACAALGGMIHVGDYRYLWFIETVRFQPNQTDVETIFIALDRDIVPVPVDRLGSGGGMTSVGNDLILLTHEGRFFDVTGDAAVPLSIVPPNSGWDAMLAFDKANSEYTFANFYFRYNDLDVFEDRLIVSYTEWVADDDCYRNTIATAPLGGAGASADIALTEQDWEVLYSTAPCLPPKEIGIAVDGHMAGGRFTIDADGTLYLASGDYAFDGTNADISISQDPDQDYGKIIAVDLATGAAETISQGHSNMQGITLSQDGTLYAIEHGRRGGDELNEIVAGGDYGWPQVSLGTRYNRLPLSGTLEYGRHPTFEKPVYSWLPSIAVSALTRVDGFHPTWDGDLLAGSLVAQSLFRIRIEDGRVLFAEEIPLGARLRYIHQHGDEIAIWTDHKYVMRLSVGEFDTSTQFAVNKLAELDLSNRQRAQAELTLDGCVQCHSLGVLQGSNAPALGEVYGREIASDPSFAYSQALSSKAGNWTRANLIDFLTDPDAFASGTTMPNQQIAEPAVIEAMVDILEGLKDDPE